MTNGQTRVNTVIIHESLKQTQAARFDWTNPQWLTRISYGIVVYGLRHPNAKDINILDWWITINDKLT